MTTVFVILQLLGRFFSEIIRVRNIGSHFLAIGSRFVQGFGVDVVVSRALPHYMFLRYASTSSREMGVTVAVLSSSVHLRQARHSFVISLTRWLATAFGFTDGLVELGRCWPELSLRMTCQPFRLDCV